MLSVDRLGGWAMIKSQLEPQFSNPYCQTTTMSISIAFRIDYHHRSHLHPKGDATHQSTWLPPAIKYLLRKSGLGI